MLSSLVSCGSLTLFIQCPRCFPGDEPGEPPICGRLSSRRGAVQLCYPRHFKWVVFSNISSFLPLTPFLTPAVRKMLTMIASPFHDVLPLSVKAKALYTYEPTSSDELALEEGQIVDIVDKSEAEWWKAERDGLVLVVPATYLELMG